MAIKYTQSTLDKIEKVLDEGGYVLRFEKGTFNSGYCVLEHKKVVVVNKFLDLEGRINTLMDILGLLRLEPHALSPESQKIYALAAKESAGKVSPPQDEGTVDGNQETT
jgi:hypothetical protein